jgi:hypothetical protein
VTFVRRVYGVDEAAANARWILPGKLADASTRPLYTIYAKRGCSLITMSDNAAGLGELKRMISEAKRDANTRVNNKRKKYERRRVTTDSREDRRRKRVCENIYWNAIAEHMGLHKVLTEPNNLINVYDSAFTIAVVLVGDEDTDPSEQYEECFKIVRSLMRSVTNLFIDIKRKSVDMRMKPIDYIMAD